MNPNKKAIFKTYIEPPGGGLSPSDDPDDYPLERLTISSESSATSAVCGFVLDTPAYIYQEVPSPSVVDTGNYVYQDNTLNFPFQGNNQYYRVSIDPLVSAYFARINNDGLIVEIGLCI